MEKIEGEDSEFYSVSINNTKTPTDKEENGEANTSFTGSSKHNQNENLEQHSQKYNTEKLQIESEETTLGKSDTNIFDKTHLASKSSSLELLDSTVDYETTSDSKDISSRISNPVSCNENITEIEASSTQISKPFITDGDSSESKISLTSKSSKKMADSTGLGGKVNVPDEIASETKDNSSARSEISSLVTTYDRVSDNKSSSIRISSPEQFDETSLQIKFSSLQIYETFKSNENASDKNTDLPLKLNQTIFGERSSELSNISAGNLFNKDSKNSKGLSSEESGLFNLPEKATTNRKEQENAARKQRHRVSPKGSQKKAYNFQTFPQSLTENTSFEWKFRCFDMLNSTVYEETPSDAISTWNRISRPTVLDVTSSDGNQNPVNQPEPKISDEASLENKFSSLQISSSVNTNDPALDNNSDFPRMCSPIDPEEGGSLSSALPLKSDAGIDPSLIRDSSRDNESSFNLPETSLTKSKRKLKKIIRKSRPLSHPKVNENEGKECRDVAAAKTSEIQIESKDESSGISSNQVADETTSENTTFQLNKNRELDEDIIRCLHILACDTLCGLSNLYENISRNTDTIYPNKVAENQKESKLSPKASLGDHRGKAVRSSTSKISPSDKSNKEGLLQKEADRQDSKMKVNIPHAQDNSVELRENPSYSRNSSLNQRTHLASASGNTKASSISNPHQIEYIELDGILFPLTGSKNPLKTKSSKKGSRTGIAVNKREVVRNRSRADSSNAVKRETESNLHVSNSSELDGSETSRNKSRSDSNKADNSETNKNLSKQNSSKTDDGETDTNQPQPHFNKEKSSEMNRNPSQSDSSKADSSETSRN